MELLDLVGNTPLLVLPAVSKSVAARDIMLFAKAEFFNPSGSVKDRAAKAMILGGLREGLLAKGKTIIDATSGNTGIAYAMIGAALSFPVKIYLPANASAERKGMIRHYGAEIVETSPLEGSDGAYWAVKEEIAAHPEKYFYPDQYHNDANWKAHYTTTAPEIWTQSEQRITHFICGMGTSGTFVGVSRRLKEYKTNIRTIAIQPDSPFHGIEGTKHMASTLKPGFYDETLPDEVIEISTEGAYAMSRRLAREEGIHVGISSGANVLGALKLAETLPSGSVVITILCDTGARYVTDQFWSGHD
ncbi:MAG: cysteine synthase family protein [Burkholderiales bacterium]|jgi:cysteine synthase B|nr:cysteine synthase family protein [Burkholderiales bacterium]